MAGNLPLKKPRRNGSAVTLRHSRILKRKNVYSSIDIDSYRQTLSGHTSGRIPALSFS